MDYVINHTKAMEQWDYELNNKYNYDPKKMTVGSEIKVWWKCSKGHSFDMRICHKMRNEAGCPFCSGLRVCDDNNLEVLYPNLVKYWDNEKNTVKMNEITPNTTKVAYWICDNGHSFTMPINRRLKMKKCPICSGQRITIDNCLETVKPELAKEWNYEKNGDLSPKDVMSGTHKRVWWICSKCNHEWETPVYSRGIGNCGCPKCDSEKRTSFPEQAILFYLQKFTNAKSRIKVDKSELDIYVPDFKVGIEYDGEFHHSRKGSLEREERKNKKMVSNKVLLIRVKEKRKSEFIVEVKKQYYGYDIVCQYNQNYLFIEKLMDEILKILKKEFNICYSIDVNIKKDKNEIMNQYIINEKNNSLLIKKPLGALKWDYDKNGNMTPDKIPYSSTKRFMFKCQKCNYEWESAVANIQNTETCPNCVHSYNIVDGKDYNLASIYPHLLSEWDFVKNSKYDPYQITPGSNLKVWWFCSKCNNNYQMDIKHRSSGGKCPKCGLENANIAKYKKIINLDTGEIYNSLKEVAIKYKLSSTTAITACIRGRAKTCRGFRWAYYEENKKVNDK